jgi:hypothetical protein
MNYETVTTLSGDRVVLDLVVGNFVHVLETVHSMDRYVFDLVVRAARHTEQHPAVAVSAILPHLTATRDSKDAAKLLEALVILLRTQEQ